MTLTGTRPRLRFDSSATQRLLGARFRGGCDGCNFSPILAGPRPGDSHRRGPALQHAAGAIPAEGAHRPAARLPADAEPAGVPAVSESTVSQSAVSESTG